MSATYISADKPKYSSPAKNLSAAQAAAAELPHLAGDALRKQHARVKELLDVANQQNAEFIKTNPGAGASQVVHSARDTPGKSGGQASSPHVSRKRAGSVNSKQITLNNPVVAGKRVAEQGNVGQGNADNPNVGRRSHAAGQGGNASQNSQDRHGVNSAAGG
jgi:hypothetical protein